MYFLPWTPQTLATPVGGMRGVVEWGMFIITCKRGHTHTSKLAGKLTMDTPQTMDVHGFLLCSGERFRIWRGM